MQCIHVHNCKYNYCTVQKQASPLIPHPSFFFNSSAVLITFIYQPGAGFQMHGHLKYMLQTEL